MNNKNVGYYYCSVETFFNIIKNKSLFLSDPLKMNDKEEITWFFKMFNESVKNKEDKDKLIIDEVNKELEKKGQSYVFVVCFSKNGDLLSQWRAYANDGTGVCIGFDLEKLKNKNENLKLCEIKYSKKYTKEIDTIIDQIEKCRNIREKGGNKEAIIELLTYAINYKNIAFIEENEQRLIYREKETENNLDHEFRMSGNDFTEYVKLAIDKDDIVEIHLGPKCIIERSDIRKLTKKYINKANTKVVRSNSTYR